MKLKFAILEDFVNYKKPCMFLGFPRCDFKCDKECGNNICQNSLLVHQPDIDYNIPELVSKYLQDELCKAVVCGGLEPFDSWNDLQAFIIEFKHYSSDPIIIYTGYKEEEIDCEKIKWIKAYAENSSIIIKFGRFIPNQPHHIDPILGVELASSNQYAKEFFNENN